MKDKGTNSSNSPVLEAKGLGIGYYLGKEALPVARQIAFSVGAGTLAAIVGVNGIGKSTLLRTLGRVQPALEGAIYLNGKPLEHISDKALSLEISLVLTEPIATKNLRVIELVSLGRQPHTSWLGNLTATDGKIVRSAIETVGLVPLQFKKCHELSDGQLQKVLIARALAQDTPLMLLDEPTTHLDLYHKVQILNLLREIAHKKGKTIVFTTHEIDMAIQLCDSMLLLDNNDNPFGQPCELIAGKRFEKLFPQDLIRFDARSGTFRVRKSSRDTDN